MEILMMNARKLVSAMMLAGITAFSMPASAVELIQNGGFETQGVDANDIINWNQAEVGFLGGVLADTGTTTAVTANTSAGAFAGNYYGLLDNWGNAQSALYQTFTATGVTSATLSFNMFVNNQNSSTEIANSGLDFTTLDPNQHVRVDLLKSSASTFSTDNTDILQSFVIGGATGSQAVNGYGAYNFNISNILASDGNYTLRFASVANQSSLQLGVDNVSINAVAAVPEAETYAMMLAGLGLLSFVSRRRNKNSTQN